MPTVSLAAGEQREIFTGDSGDVLFINTDGTIRVSKWEQYARHGRTITADQVGEIELREPDESVYVHAEEDATVEYELQGFSVSLFGREVIGVDGSSSRGTLPTSIDAVSVDEIHTTWDATEVGTVSTTLDSEELGTLETDITAQSIDTIGIDIRNNSLGSIPQNTTSISAEGVVEQSATINGVFSPANSMSETFTPPPGEVWVIQGATIEAYPAAGTNTSEFEVRLESASEFVEVAGLNAPMDENDGDRFELRSGEWVNFEGSASPDSARVDINGQGFDSSNPIRIVGLNNGSSDVTAEVQCSVMFRVINVEDT